MILKPQRTLRSQRLLPLARSFHEEAKASSQRAAHPFRMALCSAFRHLKKTQKNSECSVFSVLKKSQVMALLLLPVFAVAQTEFTGAEQQSINVETPGLFEKSDSFTIDFNYYKAEQFCFPLPVGKAVQGKDYYIEIETKKGDAVKAMFDGTVRLSRQYPDFGNVIVIRHTNGLETVYGRNAQNMVKVGDRVKAGQTIAIVGGDGSRAYCEFAIMVNGRRINPGIIVALKGHRLLRQTVMCKRQGFSISVSVMEPDPWTDQNLAKKKGGKGLEASDPFAGGQRFTLNLANITDDEWHYPLPGSHVISPYGPRGGRRHTGVDLKTKANDDILAAFDGVVTMSQVYSGYGNCIVLRHVNGLETLYSHNSRNLVKVGDQVKVGQRIALTGRTGRATTEHLHFETRVNGRPFDPSLIFNHVSQRLRTDKVTFTKGGGASVQRAAKQQNAGRAKKVRRK